MKHERRRNYMDNDVVILRNRSFSEYFVSRKLGAIVALYLLLFISLVFVLVATFSPDLRKYISIDEKPAAILLPLAAVLVGAVIKVYDIADTRLGTVDLFTNEILNVARVIYSSALTDALIVQYYNPQFADYPESNRNENYMMVFEKHSRELGFLPRRAIAQITAFYTLLKGARDTRGMLSLYRDNTMKPEDRITGKKGTLLRTLYLLFLTLEAGYYALQELVDDKDEFSQYEPLFLRSMSLAYLFLLDHLPEQDDRRIRMQNQRRRNLFSSGLLEAYKGNYSSLAVRSRAANSNETQTSQAG